MVGTIVTLTLWVLGMVLAVVLLDLARQPVRRALAGVAAGFSRLMCALRREVLLLRDAARRWHHAHLARLEAERIQITVQALERRYADLVGHDLAELPDLRQRVHEALRDLEDAYIRDEDRLVAEPAWVGRLEGLATTPVSSSPGGQRLAHDMQETVLRIARLGMEEHRKMTHGLLVARRRVEGPLRELTNRLEQIHYRLIELQRQGERLDQGLARCEQQDLSLRRQLPAYAQAGSQWLLGAAGLVLVGIAAWVYRELFGAAIGVQFPVSARPDMPAFPDLVIAVLLGTGAVSGWLLAETRGVSRLLPESLLAGGGTVRRVVVAVATVALTGVVLLSGVGGFHLEWVAYRQELLDTLLAGRAAVPASLDWFEQSLGALLGLLIPMLVALAPIWLAGLLQATRVLLGGALSLLLSILAGLLYLVAVFAGQIRRLMPVAFDLVTFPSRVVRERFE